MKNYFIKIVPVPFANGFVIHTIHVFFEGRFVGVSNHKRQAAHLLTALDVPLAEAIEAIEFAKAEHKKLRKRGKVEINS